LALTRFGGYSDTVCVPAAQVVRRPKGMGVRDGAALPVDYLTAYQLVVIMGGIAAIQLARLRGARVIGTASSSKHAFLQQLGVEDCIDYTQENFETRVRDLTGGRGVELVIDAVAGEPFRYSFRVLAPTGRLGMFGFSASATWTGRSLTGLVKVVLRMPWWHFTPTRLMNQNRGGIRGQSWVSLG